nr:hypothetical protein [Desulfobacteraceae bacterium]
MRKIFFLILLLLVPSGLMAEDVVVDWYPVAATGCTPTYGTELHTAANAAEPDVSDTDAVTGFSQVGLLTWDSVDTAPHIGTYHITAIASSSVDRFYYNLSGLTDGTLYSISAHTRHNGTGGDWRLGLGTSSGGVFGPGAILIATADTTYIQWTLYFYKQYNIAYVVALENNATDDGGIYFDNFSI